MSGTPAWDDPAGAPVMVGASAAAHGELRRAASLTAEALVRWACLPGPGGGADPDALAAAVARLDPCPADGQPLDRVLDEVGSTVLAHGVRPFDPRCVAHLHCPTLVSSAAAEMAVGATNQSLDSYDQAPAATLVEDHLTRWLARTVGLPAAARGVLTAGGTASNLLGLLLARDRAARRAGASVAHDGLPAEAATWRIVCSRATHFSVQRAAAILGLGHRAVLAVGTGPDDRIDLASLDRALEGGSGRVIAVVGTAGTTDAGAIDPLDALAERARAIGAWLHVDAAVGGALALSAPLQGMLRGIEDADSVTVDLHKLWWQPIGASALLARDPSGFEQAVRHHSDYLDRPEDDPDDGAPLNLVGRSLDTSRRFDALKILISLRTVGRRRLASMVEHLVATASATARLADQHPRLELLCPPSTVTVLFRYHPGTPARSPVPSGDTLDRVNTSIQRELFATGQAVLGRTRTRQGAVALKLTLVNPEVTADALAELLDLVVSHGDRLATTDPAGPSGPAGPDLPTVEPAVPEVTS